MSDFVFNIAKGAVAEMVRDSAADVLILLLKASVADATAIDYDTVAAVLGDGSTTEADFSNYARKTGLTGSITVDDSNDRVDVDVPDQTWSSAGNGSNNTLTDAVIAYENAAADATRIPCTQQDFAVTTDGSDLTLEVNSAGFYRAA